MKSAWLIAVLLVAGCVDEPTPQEAQKAATSVETDASQDKVKQRQLSIEEAAEEATKLIEADAKAEVDLLITENPAN